MTEIAGLKLITPSSVTSTGSGNSASASPTGKIIFSSCDTISVNDVFSASYDNYLIVCRVSLTSGATVSLRMRSSGSDDSGSNYSWQRLLATSTTVSGLRSSSDNRGPVGSGQTESGFHGYIYGPYLAQPTVWRGVTAVGRDTIRIDDFATTHSLSTSYTGFTVLQNEPATGSMTIYGLSQ